jgi:hypothetical protein
MKWVQRLTVLQSKMRLLKPQENILGARRACVLESSSPLANYLTRARFFNGVR